MKMHRISIAVLPLLFSAATAFAQSPESSIRESTDPARVAEVERRAQSIRSGQSAGSSSQSQMQEPAAGEYRHRHSEGKRGHGHRHGHGHHRMHHDHPKAAPNAGK